MPIESSLMSLEALVTTLTEQESNPQTRARYEEILTHVHRVSDDVLTLVCDVNEQNARVNRMIDEAQKTIEEIGG